MRGMRTQPAAANKRATIRTGTAATEFALVIPVLMLLAIACVDFGRIATDAEILSNAARSGAEVGGTQQFTTETEPMWRTKVHDAVVEEMQNVANFRPSDFEVNISTTTDAQGVTRVVVDASYKFRTRIAWPGLPAEVPLRERVLYRQFR